MFCHNCGNNINDGVKFCPFCGAPQSRKPVLGKTAPVQPMPDSAAPSEAEGVYVTPNIVRCNDGVYRWTYEVDMLKNPTILFTVFKVLAISFGITFLIGALVSLFSGDISSLPGFIPVFLILMGVFMVIGAIAYLIVAASYGGKYMVLFEMNERQVTHIQMASQFKKAQALAWLGMFVAIAGRNPAGVGLNIVNMTKDRTISTFNNVSSVKAVRSRNVIYVNEALSKNQVYAADTDFDFVENFIMTHCPKLR